MHVGNPMNFSGLNHIAAYYLFATTFYAIIWTARLSILLSIIRMHPHPVTPRHLKWLAAAFIAAFLFLIAQLFWNCENIHDGWKYRPSSQCHLPKTVAICQLVGRCIFFSTFAHSLQELTQFEQLTSSPISPSFCCPSGSSEASRTNVFAGVSSSSFPPRVCHFLSR
jgi:hypothetical protein